MSCCFGVLIHLLAIKRPTKTRALAPTVADTKIASELTKDEALELAEELSVELELAAIASLCTTNMRLKA